MSDVKNEAMKIIENLSEEATWEDLIYQIYVKEKIDKAVNEVEEGYTVSHEEAKKKLMKL